MGKSKEEILGFVPQFSHENYMKIIAAMDEFAKQEATPLIEALEKIVETAKRKVEPSDIIQHLNILLEYGMEMREIASDGLIGYKEKQKSK